VCAALAWGTGDFCGGLATRIGHIAATMLLSQGAGFALCLAITLVQHEPAPGTEAVVWSVAAGISGIVGIAGFYAALSRGTMGLVAPLTALIAAGVPATVGIVNGQAPGPVVMVGMLAALAAVLLISLPDTVRDRSDRRDRPPRLRLRGSRATETAFVTVAGLGFAGFFLGISAAHSAGGAVWWPLLLVRSAGLLVTLAGVGALRVAGRVRDLGVPRRSVPLATLAGAGDLGGNVFFLLAASETLLPVAVVLSSLYPVQTTLLARLLLRERLTPVRWIGVGLALAAVALVSVGTAGG
jgi:drug/metabolite transporter (DMT)-like permease